MTLKVKNGGLCKTPSTIKMVVVFLICCFVCLFVFSSIVFSIVSSVKQVGAWSHVWGLRSSGISLGTHSGFFIHVEYASQ